MTDETNPNDKPTPDPQDNITITHHTVTIGGQEMRYTATALMKGDSLPKNGRAKIVKKLARYTGLTPEYIEQTNLRNNYSMTFYEAGHMMYIHLPSLEKLKGDLAGFVEASTP